MISWLERQRREDAREAYEKRRLSDYAWDAKFKVESATIAQLEAAAKLKDQPGELGYVGRMAQYELERRGK